MESDNTTINRLHIHRTRYNWKKNYGVDIPVEKHALFKQYKKVYLQLHLLDRELMNMFLDNLKEN